MHRTYYCHFGYEKLNFVRGLCHDLVPSPFAFGRYYYFNIILFPKLKGTELDSIFIVLDVIKPGSRH